MKAFVPAAGFGRRMETLTARMPKPLLPVGGVPMIAYSLFLLYLWKVEAAVINLHYRGEQIRTYLKDFPHFPLHFSPEKELLETAGGIRNAIDRFLSPEEKIIVLNPDTILRPTDQDKPREIFLEESDACLFLQAKPSYKNQTSFAFIESEELASTSNIRMSADGNYYYIGYALLALSSLLTLKKGVSARLRNVWQNSAAQGRLRGKLFQGQVWDGGDAIAYENIKDPSGEIWGSTFWKKKWEEFLEGWSCK